LGNHPFVNEGATAIADHGLIVLDYCAGWSAVPFVGHAVTVLVLCGPCGDGGIGDLAVFRVDDAVAVLIGTFCCCNYFVGIITVHFRSHPIAVQVVDMTVGVTIPSVGHTITIPILLLTTTVRWIHQFTVVDVN
jgi:hypothetical protein